ncbi:MAG: T9SS type A sorting domain-containing protein [Bacteroidales bacterium]|nr:T9SS type A sorting domain-containing protein [Bacteroidales bacterium]
MKHCIQLACTLAEPGRVQIQLYNVTGQRVTELIDQNMTSGNYSLIWDAGSCPSGNYYLKILLSGHCEILKGIVKK